MFLLPNHPTDSTLFSHWHRLLGLVEVPTRMHRQLGNPLNFTRVPGRLNFNTMRHPEVLAGAIDDPQLHSEPDRYRTGGGVDTNGNGFVNDGVRDRNTTGPVRDYWYDMLQSRDGTDPVSGLVLPGTTASRPFRDAGVLTGGGASGQDGLSRAHPNSGDSTGSAATDRHLFDTGTNIDSGNPAGTSNAGTNYYLKNRLLSKLAGNASTRSNVFFVYLTVRFHEVHETATGDVRIGGRFDLNGDGDGGANDEHRALFMIDRSDAEKAYEPATGTFRWEEIVKHRVPIN